MKLGPPPSFDLSDRHALVTGAGRGIGLAAAAALAHAGAHVLLVARSESEIRAAVEAIRDGGNSADCETLDVTDTAAVRELIERRGPFDILVNNAGMNRPRLMVDTSEGDVDDILGLNVRAAYFVAQAVVRGLIQARKPGTIINVSSQMGHVGGARRTVYCMSKHAIEGLTKAMALELGPVGIRVNSVCPTFVETALTKPFLNDPDFRHEVVDQIALQRIGSVDDVTGAIIYLASNASALVTGSALMVDGGWTAK